MRRRSHRFNFAFVHLNVRAYVTSTGSTKSICGNNSNSNSNSNSSSLNTSPSLPYLLKSEWSLQAGHALQQNLPPTVSSVDSERTQGDWCDLAQHNLMAYRLQVAETALQRARHAHGADPMMQRQLLLETVLYVKQGRGNMAMATMIELLTRYPLMARDPVGMANLGVVLSLNKDHVHAREVLESVPRTHAIWFDQAAAWLAETYTSLGLNELAQSIIAEVCQTYSELQEDRITRELAHADACTDLHRLGLSCVRVKNMQLYGGILLQNGDTARAVRVLEQAVAEGNRILGPNDVITCKATTMLGLAYGYANRLQDAVRVMLPALQHLQDNIAEYPDSNLMNGWKVATVYLQTLRRWDDALHAALCAREVTAKIAAKKRTTMNGAEKEKWEVELIRADLRLARAYLNVGRRSQATDLLSVTLKHTTQTALRKEVLELLLPGKPTTGTS